jgi:hypothetical protein
MANLYKIEDLLIGKVYRSKTLTGEIVSAEKDNRAVWYGDNTESYLVEVNSIYRNKWRTVAVKVGE